MKCYYFNYYDKFLIWMMMIDDAKLTIVKEQLK